MDIRLHACYTNTMNTPTTSAALAHDLSVRGIDATPTRIGAGVFATAASGLVFEIFYTQGGLQILGGYGNLSMGDLVYFLRNN